MAARSDSTGSPPRQIKSEKECKMAEITDKIKLPVRVEQHREAIGETGDYDYFWLLLDSDGTQVAWWLDGDKEKGIAEQIRDSLNDPTPASTAPKEVVEKYAAQLRMLKFPGNYETEESVLTRFASEIGVDTEKVWGMAEFRTKVCLRCNKLWQDCGNSNHNDGYDAVVFTHKQLAAALKAAGGGE